MGVNAESVPHSFCKFTKLSVERKAGRKLLVVAVALRAGCCLGPDMTSTKSAAP